MRKENLLLLLFSFLIVSLAQSDFSPFCCLLAASCGYALFWKGALAFSPKHRFYAATLWFAAIQAIHLNWFFSDRYVGGAIWLFLIPLILTLGVLFGAFTYAVTLSPGRHLLALASLWTIGEWSRLFVLSGFSWDPVGLALSATLPGLQWAALFGVFGLTFWVVLTNLCALKLLQEKNLQLFISWVVLAILPYAFGYAHLSYHKRGMARSAPLSLVLVQTALYPEEKAPFSKLKSTPLSPLAQWERILTLLKAHTGKEIDLILLPEVAVPYGTGFPLYDKKEIAALFNVGITGGEGYVGNEMCAKAIAYLFNTDVVVGFEDCDGEGKERKIYNAAFHFSPDGQNGGRYEKRVLVPMGEYIPFAWCRSFLASYGISGFMTPGTHARLFATRKVPIAVSICYEETYGHLMREGRLKGGRLFANLTNDAWYPHSRLPIVHFAHGRVRAVELGIPSIRSSNTGMTCGIDSLGRTIAALPHETRTHTSPPAALHLTLSSYTYPTLYTLCGDHTIILFSLACITASLIQGRNFFYLQLC